MKTVRDLVYWEYAKLISGSAVGDRKNYGFIMHTFQKHGNYMYNINVTIFNPESMSEKTNNELDQIFNSIRFLN